MPEQNPGKLIYNAIQFVIKDFYQIRIEANMLVNLMYQSLLKTNEFLPYPDEQLYKHAIMLLTKCERGTFDKEQRLHQLNNAFESYIKLRPE